MSEFHAGGVNFINPDETKKGRGLTDRLKNLPEGDVLLLSPNSQASEMADTISMARREDYAEGRQDSVNQVWFADSYLYGKGGELLSQPVAVKPGIENEEWLSAREFRASVDLNREGVVTFQPIGFMKQHNTINLLTKFEQGVTSFDNILWNLDHPPTEQEIKWGLSCAAANLIVLHDDKYVHRDFQVKNTAYGPDLDSRVIDLTTAVKSSRPDDFTSDVADYVESLTRFGRQPALVNPDQVQEFFIENYEDTVDDIFPISKRHKIHSSLKKISKNLTKALVVN